MTKKPKSGTLSTRRSSDNKLKPSKEKSVLNKMKALLEANKIRFLNHANQRMAERNIIYYEVLQALYNGVHDAKRDRFSLLHNTWEYCIEGKTLDQRSLRIGISFEASSNQELLLVITVIDTLK